MGTFLEMILTRLSVVICRMTAVLGLGGMAVLAGCGNSNQSPVDMLLGKLTRGGGSSENENAQVDPRSVITPAYLASLDNALLSARLPDRDGFATLTVISDASGVRTWRSADGVGVSLEQGLVVATRGLGADLMLAEVGQVSRAINAGGGSARRVMRYLDGENHELARSYDCRIVTEAVETIFLLGDQSRETVRLREHCAPAGGAAGTRGFDNFYWVGNRDGVMWQSYQWIGPDVGTMQLQLLKR